MNLPHIAQELVPILISPSHIGTCQWVFSWDETWSTNIIIFVKNHSGKLWYESKSEMFTQCIYYPLIYYSNYIPLVLYCKIKIKFRTGH